MLLKNTFFKKANFHFNMPVDMGRAIKMISLPRLLKHVNLNLHAQCEETLILYLCELLPLTQKSFQRKLTFSPKLFQNPVIPSGRCSVAPDRPPDSGRPSLRKEAPERRDRTRNPEPHLPRVASPGLTH